MVRIVEQFNRAVEASPEQQALNVRRLRLKVQDHSSAIVDVDAFAVAHVSTRLGAQSLDFRFRGPFSLRHDGAEWKIEAYAVDHIPFPRGFYNPIVDESENGVHITVGAQLTKKGTLLGVEIDNRSDRPVLVSEFAMSFRPMWLFTARWGSLHVPAAVGPGERWADVVQWSGLSVRRRVTAIVRIDAEDRTFELEPPRAIGSRRRRFRPLYSAEGFFYLLLVLAAVSSAVTGTVGLLGIALVAPGAFALARVLRTLVAGFWSSWSSALGSVGLVELVVGIALMLSVGFGWIGTLVVVASLGFALQQTVLQARAIRTERARRERGLREG